jgi:hypothetical protein
VRHVVGFKIRLEIEVDRKQQEYFQNEKKLNNLGKCNLKEPKERILIFKNRSKIIVSEKVKERLCNIRFQGMTYGLK